MLLYFKANLTIVGTVKVRVMAAEEVTKQIEETLRVHYGLPITTEEQPLW